MPCNTTQKMIVKAMTNRLANINIRNKALIEHMYVNREKR